ncbi:hypothetical protein H6F98_23300 [Microcoleus sp. FACHB-SPT15]|uniref:hypothetical protein n=1 Tax=Microcoleus sp. FACHB-SPT15 TaxID=2692830 RepID=UPI00177C5CD0|nr:hypothetical protein [Microcoleus sp. FACHB-SPT15]MBD1808358.1 hypothetical protein [Microcoleus sp. FACHB-SPT15]
MRANLTQLYVHCVWATWDRLPLITPDIQEVIYASMTNYVRNQAFHHRNKSIFSDWELPSE